METIAVGNRVTWIASGKGARMDGINGQRVSGTVLEVSPDYASDCAIVKGDKSSFDGSLVPLKKLRVA